MLYALDVHRDHSVLSLYCFRHREQHPFQQHFETLQFLAELLARVKLLW